MDWRSGGAEGDYINCCVMMGRGEGGFDRMRGLNSRCVSCAGVVVAQYSTGVQHDVGESAKDTL